MIFVNTAVSLIPVDPKDPSIEYKWFDIGVLDYDEDSKLYYVQKVNSKGRVVDSRNKPIINGGLRKDGMISNYCDWKK